MERESGRGNGHGRRPDQGGLTVRSGSERSLSRERGPERGRLAPDHERPLRRPDGEALVDVARDAIDSVRVMARDGVSIIKLEATRTARDIGRDIGPRMIWAVIAAACALLGGVLAAIALFLALGAVIPSVAARLALFAGVFLLVALFGALRASPTVKPGKVVEDDEPRIRVRND